MAAKNNETWLKPKPEQNAAVKLPAPSKLKKLNKFTVKLRLQEGNIHKKWAEISWENPEQLIFHPEASAISWSSNTKAGLAVAVSRVDRERVSYLGILGPLASTVVIFHGEFSGIFHGVLISWYLYLTVFHGGFQTTTLLEQAESLLWNMDGYIFPIIGGSSHLVSGL